LQQGATLNFFFTVWTNVENPKDFDEHVQILLGSSQISDFDAISKPPLNLGPRAQDTGRSSCG
jgi:hypothetical protein